MAQMMTTRIMMTTEGIKSRRYPDMEVMKNRRCSRTGPSIHKNFLRFGKDFRLDPPAMDQERVVFGRMAKKDSGIALNFNSNLTNNLTNNPNGLLYLMTTSCFQTPVFPSLQQNPVVFILLRTSRAACRIQTSRKYGMEKTACDTYRRGLWFRKIRRPRLLRHQPRRGIPPFFRDIISVMSLESVYAIIYKEMMISCTTL
mmetsp:Transcript_16599/g.33240  ORF Transcript_16599/g.33240 Transcript_16599/m.33240 type:complete len:200 (-) Transcript_16599:555-1154(-)